MPRAEGIWKVCVKCKQTKDVLHFNKNACKYDGLENRCRCCQKVDYINIKKARLAVNYLVRVGDKTCSSCELSKVVTEFYIDKKTKDGRTVACKTCKKRRASAYKKKNLAKVREGNKFSHYDWYHNRGGWLVRKLRAEERRREKGLL